MRLKSFVDIEEALKPYIPAVREMAGKSITRERMYPMMAALGNPQDKLRLIHIAGTSGKTSTAYYLAALFRTAGKSVGLTVSPHIDTVAERLQINMQPISAHEFGTALEEFLDRIRDVSPQPTYFELLMAFAYWYFAKQNVDYAVIEAGFGGLHDASNIAKSPDKVCVITDIGYDHMKILGDTLPEISAQKAGIIHPGNEVFLYRQTAEVTEVFERQARIQQASIHLLDQNELAKTYPQPGLTKLPLYQQRNWLLARQVFEFVKQRDGLADTDVPRLARTLDVRVPGRMDERMIHGKTLIMDGAHNDQKMSAFVSSFSRRYPHQKAAVLMTLREGKQLEKTLKLLKPITARLIITTFDILQDLPSRSIDPALLADTARQLGFEHITVEPDPAEAYKRLISSPEDTLVITGSFYLLSCIRPFIIPDHEHKHDPRHSRH